MFKYIVFDYEGQLAGTDDEDAAEDYKEYDSGILMNTQDQTVWDGSQWVTLTNELSSLKEEESDDEGDSGRNHGLDED